MERLERQARETADEREALRGDVARLQARLEHLQAAGAAAHARPPKARACASA